LRACTIASTDDVDLHLSSSPIDCSSIDNLLHQAPEKQTELWKWISDNVDFRVRSGGIL